MRGSVQLTFDEFTDDLGFDGLFMGVGAYEDRYNRFIDCDRIYTTFVNTGELFEIELSVSPLFTISSRIVVYRIDYTTDDVNGDNGVKETYIGENVNPSGSTYYSFTATTRPDAYAFEYRVKCYTDGCFPANVGFNNEVIDSEIQPDGKILCSGLFTQYSGISVNNICRLNPDGTLDTTFNYTQPSEPITGVGDMKLLSDGKIITRISSYRIARINSNGSIDTSFNIGTLNNFFYPAEEVIAIQSDGKILVGGNFATYTSAGQTSTKKAIVRLNSDGTIDNTFNQFGTGFTANAETTRVENIKIQSDGKILLSGAFFYIYNGTLLNNPGLIRLNPDGSLDTSFIRNTSINVSITHLELFSDGKILFSNVFGGYNGNNNRKLVRLNSDGSLDTTFNSLALSPPSVVQEMLIDETDRAYIGGIVIIYSGITMPSLFRINYDGTRDTTFNDGAGFTQNGSNTSYEIRDIELTESGCLYGVGKFTSYYSSGTALKNIVKIRPNGTPFVC
jgi:uncharacterized delta-60 repeat protein